MSEAPLSNKSLLPRALREFMQTEASSGIVMLLFAALALIAANSPLSARYVSFTDRPITFGYSFP